MHDYYNRNLKCLDHRPPPHSNNLCNIIVHTHNFILLNTHYKSTSWLCYWSSTQSSHLYLRYGIWHHSQTDVHMHYNDGHLLLHNLKETIVAASKVFFEVVQSLKEFSKKKLIQVIIGACLMLIRRVLHGIYPFWACKYFIYIFLEIIMANIFVGNKHVNWWTLGNSWETELLLYNPYTGITNMQLTCQNPWTELSRISSMQWKEAPVDWSGMWNSSVLTYWTNQTMMKWAVGII